MAEQYAEGGWDAESGSGCDGWNAAPDCCKCCADGAGEGVEGVIEVLAEIRTGRGGAGVETSRHLGRMLLRDICTHVHGVCYAAEYGHCRGQCQ